MSPILLIATGRLDFLNDRPGYEDPQAQTMVELEVRRRHEREFRSLQSQENRLARRRLKISALSLRVGRRMFASKMFVARTLMSAVSTLLSRLFEIRANPLSP